MDNVLIDRSASGFDFRRWTDDGDAWRSRNFTNQSLPASHSSLLSLPQFQYPPYLLHSSLSLPPLLPRRPPLPPAAAKNRAEYATLPPPPLATMSASVMRRAAAGEYKRKKQPRAPRVGDEPPSRVQRRKPLERAAPLPPAPAVDEALDDLEREVVRGFVEDLMHVLAPPPSSLPLPTFSLVKAKAAAAAPCTAI